MMQKTIKIDIDDRNTFDIERFLWALRNLLATDDNVKIEEVEVYETKKGYHIYLHLKQEIPPLQCLIWQCLLGSDINRELFNYMRIKDGDKNWNVLFKRKWCNGYFSKEEKTENATKIENEIKNFLKEVKENVE